MLISFIVIISLLLILVITRPLKKLTKVVECITNGNFDIRVSYKSNDEIGFLSKSFMGMSAELKRNFKEINYRKQELKEYNQRLEGIVREKTEDLANSLIEMKKAKDMADEAHHKLKERNEEMLEELNMARTVQLNMIPKANDFPQREELNFGYQYSSMDEVGGDLYDVMRIDKNAYGFLIADVSGHGVPAALITSMAKVSFNSNSVLDKSTADICENVNEELYSLIGNLSYFLTAYYCVINLETGVFEFTNAGHHPAILMPSNNRNIEKLDTEGFLIGAFNNITFGSEKRILNEGDRILLFTDGIVEAKNDDESLYGYDRLTSFIYNNYDKEPKTFVDDLVKDVENFCGKRPPDDDRAILFIEFISKIKTGNSTEETLNIESRTLSGQIKEYVKDNSLSKI